MNKVIINFTPTGVIPTKKMTPWVPISISEIIDSVLSVRDKITIAHLHARTESEEPSLDKEIYAKIIDGIRKYDKSLIICVSLSGRAEKNQLKRISPLQLDGELKPDMGSLTLSSLNFNKQASINEPNTIKILATEMKKLKIKPELEVFDLGMANYMKYLIEKDLLLSPFYVNIILGNIACSQVNPLHLGAILNDLPLNSFWSVGGIGNFQLPANSMAIALGGGVRVGIEDNIWLDQSRTIYATNKQLVERVEKLININEKCIMSPIELRAKLGLEMGNGKYGSIT